MAEKEKAEAEASLLRQRADTEAQRLQEKSVVDIALLQKQAEIVKDTGKCLKEEMSWEFFLEDEWTRDIKTC